MSVVSQQSWYLDWFNSSFYQKLHFQQKDEEASHFIHALIRHIKPAHGVTMLDTACGRGHQAKELSALGFDVTAIDLSEKNVDYARPMESSRLRFYLHDLRLPFWINYFHYAWNLFNRFGYYRTRREHDDAVRTIAGSLRAGGYFIVDYMNVRHQEERQVSETSQVIGSTQYLMRHWDDETHFYKKTTITDPALDQPYITTEQQAKLGLGDFTDMLSFQSLQIQEVFGDYMLSPYDVKKSPRLIIIAKKKGSDASDREKRLYSDGRATDALT
jgi:hypothetical protein